MNTTWYEKGIEQGIEQGRAVNATWYEKGIEKGIEKERREAFRELLEERFGPLSRTVLDKLDQLSLERLLDLRKASFKTESLRDLGLVD